MDNPQNLGILFHIQHYIDDIDVEFQVNDTILGSHRELIEFSAGLNLHMHTILNGNQLSPNDAKSEIHFNDKTIDSNVLLSLYQRLASQLSGNVEAEGRTDVNLEYLRDIYHSINSQLNTAMMIRDENVEPDLESFRWIQRGKSGVDVLLKKIKEDCSEVKHLILEKNQLSEIQRLNCIQVMNKSNLPQLSSLTLCYDNYSLFFCQLLLSREFSLHYLRVSDAILAKEDVIALMEYLSQQDCPLHTLVLENIPITRFVTSDQFSQAVLQSTCFTRLSRKCNRRIMS